MMKNKNMKWIFLITIITIVIVVIFVVMKVISFQPMKVNQKTNLLIEDGKEKQLSTFFANPDRLIYKVKGEDKYYLFTKQEDAYVKILQKVDEGLKFEQSNNSSSEQTLSEEKLNELRNNLGYLTLSYDEISNDRLIFLEEDNSTMANIYKQTASVGARKLVNLDEVMDLIQEAIKGKEVYTTNQNEVYLSKNDVTNDMQGNEVIHKIARNLEEYQDLAEKYQIDIEKTITERDFQNSKVIVSISKYDFEEVNASTSNIVYHLGGYQDTKYHVQVLIVSNIINSNCIYDQKDLELYHNYDGIIEKVEGNKIYLSDYISLKGQKIAYIQTEQIVEAKQGDQISVVGTKIEKVGEDVVLFANDVGIVSKEEVKDYKEEFFAQDNYRIYCYASGKRDGQYLYVVTDGGDLEDRTFLIQQDELIEEVKKSLLIGKDEIGGSIIEKDLDSSYNGTILFELEKEVIPGNMMNPDLSLKNIKVTIPIKVTANTKRVLGNKDYVVQDNYDVPLHEITTIVLNKKITKLQDNSITALAMYFIAD